MRLILVKSWSIVTACVLVVAFSGLSHAQPTKEDLTLFAAKIPGFMGGNEPDPGILVEMIRLAAEKSGYGVEHKVFPWARAMMLARTSENALIAGISRLPAREHNFTWIVQLMEVDSAFIALDRKIDTYDEAQTLPSIGVHRATSHEVDLENRGFENIRGFNNLEQSIKFLQRGRIAAWYGVVNEFTKRSRSLDSELSSRVVIGKPVLVEKLWLAGPKSLPPAVIEDLVYGTRLIIEEGHRDKLLLKYFGRE